MGGMILIQRAANLPTMKLDESVTCWKCAHEIVCGQAATMRKLHNGSSFLGVCYVDSILLGCLVADGCSEFVWNGSLAKTC